MKATPWDTEKLAAYDLRRSVPPHVVEIINTPHDHEGENNKPLWIIWKHVDGFPPVLDTICDTPDSAVYHYGMLAQEIEQRMRMGRKGGITAHVERVPANHRLASSLNDVFTDMTFTAVRPTGRNGYRYKRSGD